jgi:hypothetical protein
MDVIYEFDRLHEGQPDKYWAASKKDGFQFRFDADQILDVIFLYITPSDGFAAISRQDCDIRLFTTTAEVQAFGESERLQVKKGSADLLGVSHEWVRLGFATHSIHYEYQGAILAVVTVTRNNEHRAA